LTQTCTQCGASSPPGATRCSVCGANLSQQASTALVTRRDIFDYSCYTVGLILVAIAVPCLVGLLCILLSH
jgi:uncharacterized OB-fold protein